MASVLQIYRATQRQTYLIVISAIVSILNKSIIIIIFFHSFHLIDPRCHGRRNVLNLG
jgi:hypothetical protein